MRQILEKCRSVEDAIDYLKNVPIMGRNNLTITDINNNKVIFELGYENFGIINPDKSFVVSTNYQKSSVLNRYNTRNKEGTDESYRREEYVKQRLQNAKGLNPVLAMEIMRTHNIPGHVCWHGGINNHTIAATIYIFTKKGPSILHCHGYPCQETFDPIPFDLKKLK